MRRLVLGLPLHVWLLWGAAALVLAACPMMLSDPAMWPYLLDPELLALVVIVGVEYTRLELGVLALQLRAWIGARFGRRAFDAPSRTAVMDGTRLRSGP